jgi:hypothetical protein
MAKAFFVTNAVAQAMVNALGAQIDAGTAAVINIYSGTVPANADAALGANTLLAQLVCSASAFSGVTDTGTAARATFAAIAPDASADATGTATFFRILTQNGGIVVAQGTVGTTDADLVLNTVSITAGSQVSITSALIDLPEG